jgi:hypothetical protein
VRASCAVLREDNATQQSDLPYLVAFEVRTCRTHKQRQLTNHSTPLQWTLLFQAAVNSGFAAQM